MKRLKGWLLPWLLLSLSACGVPVAYNNLDRLVRWQVGDYVTMDDRQRQFFDAAVHDLWSWHRREHLPQYAEWLDGLQFDGTTPVTDAELQALVDQVVAWFYDIGDRAVPIAAELLASLSDDQVARLAQAMADSNRELAAEELDLTVEEAQAAWATTAGDRFAQFAGRLNPAQRAYLRGASVRYIPQQVLWAEYRRRWQADLLALLAGREDGAAFGRAFEALVASQTQYYGDELTAIVDSNRRLTVEVSVWLINSLTERQRQRFNDRLTALADDFRRLAEGRGRPPPSDPLLCLVTCLP